ncbi:MAG: alpha/beta fold hydrolase [Chloroflexi bacterium]|nr:alpha/beta fold hydrolase [Chloroflexota bacterium]
MEPQIGFCTTPDGARIAYATLGQGPVMVVPPAYFHIIEGLKTIAETRSMFESLARNHTVVVYDMRGIGLSNRNRTVFTLKSELQDLETVIDHLKLDRMILFGRGFYGPVVIAYSARYPERVSHLILYGSFAYYEKYASESVKASIQSLLRQPDNWLAGRTQGSLLAPQTDINYLDWMMKFHLEKTTPEILAQLWDMLYKLDVRDLCPHIKTPTLVMHRKGDLFVEFKAGVELASLIPNAHFVPLEGDTHLPFLGDTETWMRYISEFLNDPVTGGKAKKAAQSTAQRSSHDVFISFAFPDKDAAARIYSCLKSNGISPFWCEDLTAGQDYPQLLGEAVRNSKSFLLVVSNSSDNSATVRKETTIAHNNKKPIIPVRIEDMLPKNLEYLIANSLFFDAFTQPLEQHLPRLTSDIKKIVGGKTEKKKINK